MIKGNSSMKTFKPTVEFYKENRGKKVKLGKRVVTVSYARTETRQGSYERGLKWSESEWALLIRELKGTKYWKPRRYSMDHGKTWYNTENEARRYTKKGKMKLHSSLSKEFAFDSIQRINLYWGGPSYRWHR